MAQVPDRGEPGSSGELDFTYLFQLLEDEGYQGFVGCEYRPRGDGDTRGTEVGRGGSFPIGRDCIASLLLQETQWRV